MEEATLVVSQFLAVLAMPVSIAGILVGVWTVIKRPGLRATVPPVATRRESIGVGLCTSVAGLGLIGVTLALLKRAPFPSALSVVFAVLIVVGGLPGVLWRSRFRGTAEGVATIALSIDTILSGFTIGFLFVPLVMLMISVCVQRVLTTTTESKSATASQIAQF